MDTQALSDPCPRCGSRQWFYAGRAGDAPEWACLTCGERVYGETLQDALLEQVRQEVREHPPRQGRPRRDDYWRRSPRPLHSG